VLRVESLDVAYGEIQALRAVALQVGRGEIVTILGNNGAGKTTTLKTISGLLRPTAGTITLEDEPLVGVPAHAIVARGVAHVPRGGASSTASPSARISRWAPISGATPVSLPISIGSSRSSRASPSASRRWPARLSGGEQQMLAIGRALMANPRVLLLDEPSMGLAPVLVEQIFDKISDINRQGMTILLVEQNAAMALSIAHRGYVLETGSIALEGTAAQLSDNADVRRAYLGE
jgi:branched-chain amino acid transport system ATP-binding protein